METKQWMTVDKADWPRGPWDVEPDKKQWQDEVTGLPCLIVRGPFGALCGYVGVPDTHPWHGVNYNGCTTSSCEETWCSHSPVEDIEVHGGLTFSDACRPHDDEAHGICHLPDEGEPDSVWWFGFDCSHGGDFSPAVDSRLRLAGAEYRDLQYTEQEVVKLAAQLKAVA